jgi:predicted amidophosphoribosyltransferase
VSSGVGEPSAIEGVLSFIASLLAPPRCGVCDASCSWRQPLCDGCEAKIAGARPSRPSVPGVDGAWCAAPYEGPARDLVAALKFASRLALATRAAEAIAARAPLELLDGAIVPVPPAPWRLRRRGHDPAEEIAFALARLTELPFRPVLARTTGPRQVGRRRVDRLADPPAVRLVATPPRRAVLVDDVITTGATLGACVRALRSGGAERVIAAAFARA